MAEYKLPLVEGKLIFEPVVTYSVGKVSVTVEVAYVFGGDAFGNATVSFSAKRRVVYTKSVTIESGSVIFDVDFITDLKLTQPQTEYFKVNLVFEDPMTGIKVTSTKSFTVRLYSYNFFIKRSSNANSYFKLSLTLRKTDGTPAPAGTKVQITSGRFQRDDIVYDNRGTVVQGQELTLDPNGFASSSIFIPEGAQTLLHL